MVPPDRRTIAAPATTVHEGTQRGRIFHKNTESSAPTLFHITHGKAGSQWIYAILRELFPYQIVPPQAHSYQVRKWPLQHGGVYPTVYLDREEFEMLNCGRNCKKFVVLRDLRDTLVSYYFSSKVSHALLTSGMVQTRELLNERSQEQGLILSMRCGIREPARIQQTWVQSREPFLRYEDLIANDFAILKSEFIDRLKLPITEKQLQAAVDKHRFEKQTGGRPRGQEDVSSHHRKGIAGDWKNHFTPKVTKAFKEAYGQVLIETGYEKDLNW